MSRIESLLLSLLCPEASSSSHMQFMLLKIACGGGVGAEFDQLLVGIDQLRVFRSIIRKIDQLWLHFDHIWSHFDQLT